MIDALLAAVVRARRRQAAAAPDRRRLSAPVISVGNISVGGRGKTPVAGVVARLLLEAGERPAILSRGYGRAERPDGVTVVSNGRAVLAGVATAGDEPLMLARQLPGVIVCVCEDRALAGRLAESQLGATVHVLDDGFQHHRLHRDADIVLVTPEDLGGRLMPWGRLREPADTLEWLTDAGAVLIDGASSPAIIATDRAPRAFHGQLRRALERPAALPAGSRVVAVAGIAEPERFFTAVESAGLFVGARLGFADHHRFTAADTRQIVDAVTTASATAVVTTEKDATRLEPGGWPVPLVALPLVVRVEPAEAFRAWLLGRVSAARAAASTG